VNGLAARIQAEGEAVAAVADHALASRRGVEVTVDDAGLDHAGRHGWHLDWADIETALQPRGSPRSDRCRWREHSDRQPPRWRCSRADLNFRTTPSGRRAAWTGFAMPLRAVFNASEVYAERALSGTAPRERSAGWMIEVIVLEG